VKPTDYFGNQSIYFTRVQINFAKQSIIFTL